MQSSVSKFFRNFCPVIISLLLLTLVAPALAANRHWIDAGGGSFNLTSNWSTTPGGASGASIPGVADVANFDLNATYEVDFSIGSPVTNTDVDIENGNVTFDLNNSTYTLTGFTAVAVGNVSGQTGRLTVTDGTLAVNTTGDDVTIGSSNGSGFLTVTAEGRIGDDVTNPDVVVGSSGFGSLTVNSNGRIDGDDLTIGSGLTSTGTMTITGPLAVVDMDRITTVGSSGGGTLNIFDGGSLTTGSTARIGSGNDGDGFAQVNGVGSLWTITSSTTIGRLGEGTLTVSSGGQVLSLSGSTIGSSISGDGTVTVAGVNSRWETSGLTVGDFGAANLTVSSGGQVTSTLAGSTSIGSNAGSVGRVTVTGADSQLSLASQMIVGRTGIGELTVSGGGEVSSASVTIGDLAGSVGVATITGAGSKHTVNGSIVVADEGVGTLNVTDSGEVYTSGLTVESAGGSPDGTLNLDGGSIYVDGNFNNNGTLIFTDGLLQVSGTFQPLAAAGTFTVNGEDQSDLPTLDLIGSGAEVNLTGLTVGDDRRGKLMVRQSRSLVANSGVSIGADFGGEGTVVVDSGGSLTSTGTIAVGGTSGGLARGTGLLQIGPGGTVNATTLRIFGDGTVDLDGGTLLVDTLLFSSGGQFNWSTGTLQFDSGNTNINATLANQILGPGTTLSAGQSLDKFGASTLTLSTPMTVDGGSINATTLVNQSTLEIRGGSVAGGVTNFGTMVLAGPLATISGSLTNNGTLRGNGLVSGITANQTSGRMEVIAGERMLFTGAATTNQGHISVIGGELEMSGPLNNTASTGLVSARNAILRFNGGVTNSGSMAFSNGTVDFYGDITQNVGGRITASNGGIVNFYDDVTLDAGAADVQATALGSTVSRVVFFGDYNGGVTGGGQAFIEGDHRPGNSPAEVVFDGDVFYGPFSSLEIEIGGLLSGSEFDTVEIAGAASLGGVIDVALLGGFVPQGGNEFEILSASGGIAGMFSLGSTPALTGALDWQLFHDMDNDRVLLQVVSPFSADFDLDGDVDADDLGDATDGWESRFGSDLDGGNFLDWQRQLGSGTGSLASSQAVPEPATWMLLLTASAVCFSGKLRKLR